MEQKKYQVFVSSTYVDLIEERQEIMHALLELDCIPAGMELFPAADEDQWSLIKGVIDESDYYLLVIGGRYGSISPEGLSYTEMEYRYAIATEKPVIAFLHKDPSAIPAKKTEDSSEGREKLEAFRGLAQKKMCKYWDTPQELGSVVSRSLIMLQKKHPGVGWIRADQVISGDATKEILKLRNKIESLEQEIEESKTSAPSGSEKLAKGEETFEIDCTFNSTSSDGEEWTWTYPVDISWNELFSIISPLMLHEANTLQLKNRLRTAISKMAISNAKDDKDFKGHRRPRNYSIDQSAFETVVIQLSALGLIVQSIKNRSVKDQSTYWTLTPYGVTLMNQLRAVKSQVDI